MFYRSVASKAAIRQFEAESRKTSPVGASTSFDSDLGSEVNFSLWSVKRVSAYKQSLLEKKDAPLAILRVPKINLEVPVFNDTDDLTLDRGVGRIVGTAEIGQPGNLAIAGHRDGFFRGLQNIAVGDIIEIEGPTHSDRYTVSEIRIVAPEDTYVLNSTPTRTLTLVTCFPFYFVGHAPKRYIVKASFQDARGSDSSADEDSVFADNNTKNNKENRK